MTSNVGSEMIKRESKLGFAIKRDEVKQAEQQFEEIKAWIEREKPTPDQIMKRMEELRKAKGLPTATPTK